MAKRPKFQQSLNASHNYNIFYLIILKFLFHMLSKRKKGFAYGIFQLWPILRILKKSTNAIPNEFGDCYGINVDFFFLVFFLVFDASKVD